MEHIELNGFTFAIDPPYSPCAKESFPQALKTNLLFSVLSPLYEIYVNYIINKTKRLYML